MSIEVISPVFTRKFQSVLESGTEIQCEKNLTMTFETGTDVSYKVKLSLAAVGAGVDQFYVSTISKDENGGTERHLCIMIEDILTLEMKEEEGPYIEYSMRDHKKVSEFIKWYKTQ